LHLFWPANLFRRNPAVCLQNFRHLVFLEISLSIAMAVPLFGQVLVVLSRGCHALIAAGTSFAAFSQRSRRLLLRLRLSRRLHRP
jgi:hypothetical protein